MLALAGEEMAQIGLDDGQRAVGIFVIEAPQMRRDDDVRHRPQAMVLGQRLDREDVERRAGEPAAVERAHQRIVVHRLAAAETDEIARRA